MGSTTIHDHKLMRTRRRTLKETAPVLLCQSHQRVTSSEPFPVVDLNGSSQYFRYAGTALNFGTDDFALAFTFNIDAIPATGVTATILEGGTIGNNSDFFWVAINDAAKIVFYICDGDRNYTVKAYAGVIVEAGRWYRVVIELDRDANGYITVNGTRADLGAITQPNAIAQGKFAIGRLADSAASFFAGSIGGVFVTNRLLTDLEIAWLENGGRWRTWAEFGQAGTDGADLTNAVVKAYYGFTNAALIGEDAANAVDLTAHGTPLAGVGPRSVTAWADLSGHGNDLGPTTPAKYPLVAAAALNGLPVLDFNSQSLTVAFAEALAQGYTVAVVAKATAAGVILDSSSGDHSQLARNTDSRWEFSAGTALDGTHVDTGWHVFLLVADGDTSIISVDGHEEGGAGGAATMTGITIGCDNAAANALAGGVATVVVWDRILSPAERRHVGQKLAHLYGLSYGALKVVIGGDGDTCWARIPWTATNDYILGMDLTYTTEASADEDYRSDIVGFRIAGTVPTSTSDAALPATTPTVTLHNQADDVAPLSLRGTYIGGNHGANFCIQVAATGHGKDSTDLGSSWTDATPTTWYLLRVVDANTLWFVSANASETTWTFDITMNGNLTHAAGATHTTGITVGTATLRQFFPATRTTLRKIYDHNGQELTTNGTYLVDYFDVVHEYDVLDLDAQIAAAIAGNKTEVDYKANAIDAIARVSMRNRFLPNGAVVIYSTVTVLGSGAGAFGWMQAGPLTIPSGGTVHLYVPKAKAFTLTDTEYDLAAIEDVTALDELLTLTSARWASAAAPPDRFIEFTKTSGAALYSGFELGYDITAGAGLPATRTPAVSNGAAAFFNSTKKLYTYIARTGSTAYPTALPADSSFAGCCYRVPLNFNKYATPTAVAWWQIGSTYYMAIDCHASYDGYVATPPEWEGKSVTVVEKHASATVNSTTVNKAGISLTVTDVGWAVVKVQ